MAKALKDYDIRLSDSRWDRLSFRLEHWLLSAGTSDMSKLRGYLRVKEWRDCTSPRERLRAGVVLAKLPLRALREARSAVGKHGDLGEEAGVSRGRQLAQLWWLRVRYGLRAPVYYRFQLFRPGRLRRASEYFQGNEDDDLYRLLNVRTAPDEAELLLNKARFEQWLLDREFPTVPTLVEFADGKVIRSHGLEAGLPPRDLFSKPTDALQGEGTARWAFDHGGWVGADGRRREERELIAELAELSRTQGVLLQEHLRNHPALAPLAPTALSTIRVQTLRGSDGVVRVLLAVCKIPTGKAPTDHMKFGGVAAPIDLATGRLGPAIRKDKKRLIARCEHHPDTGAVIEGFQLPHWERVQRLAVSVHEALERIVCVGWDVAVLESGPIIIEGNDNPGHSSSQVPSGVPLGETPVVPTMLAHLRASFAAPGHRTRQDPQRAKLVPV